EAFLKGISSRVVGQEQGNEKQGGHEHPPIGGENEVLLQLREQAAPTGYWFSNSQSKEAQCDLGEDVMRNQERHLGQQDSVGLRQHVTQQDVRVGGSESPCRYDEVSLFRAQHDAANQPCRTSPAEQTEDGDQQNEDLPLGNMQRRGGPHRKKQVEPGRSQEKLRRAHQDFIDPAAVES